MLMNLQRHLPGRHNREELQKLIFSLEVQEQR
jgi:hypothetical protein